MRRHPGAARPSSSPRTTPTSRRSPTPSSGSIAAGSSARARAPLPAGARPRERRGRPVVVEARPRARPTAAAATTVDAVRDAEPGAAPRRARRPARPLGLGQVDAAHAARGLAAPGRGEILGGAARGSGRAAVGRARATCRSGSGCFPSSSVRENVELPARLAGARRASREGSTTLLAALGLDELAAPPAPETSIGQQQRTALARALVLQPPVLLADEPTSHQDAGWHDRVWRAARRGGRRAARRASWRRTRSRRRCMRPECGRSPRASWPRPSHLSR